MDHKDTQVAWSLDDKSPVDIGDRDEWEFDGYDKKGRALWKPNKTGAEKAGRNKTHFCCSQLHVPLKVNQGRENKWSFSAVTLEQNLSSCDLLPMIAEFHNSSGEGARHRKAKEILTQFLESSDARDEFKVKKVYPDGYQVPGESVQPDITIEHIDDSYTYVEIVDTHAPHQNHIAWMFYETRQAQLVVIDVDDDRGWHYDKHLIQMLLIKKFERYFNDPVRTNAPKTWDERVQRHIPIAGLISKWVGEHLQEEGRLASELADARTDAEEVIESIRKTLSEAGGKTLSEAGDKVADDQKDKIKSEISDLETAINDDNLQDITAKANALKDSIAELVEYANRVDLIRVIREIDRNPPDDLDGWRPDKLEKRLRLVMDEQEEWGKNSLPLSEALAEVFESLEEEAVPGDPGGWEMCVEEYFDGDSEPPKLLLEAHYQGLSGKLRDGRICKPLPTQYYEHDWSKYYDWDDLKESVESNGWNYGRKERYDNRLNSVIGDFDDSFLDAIQVMRNALKFLSGIPHEKTDDRLGFFWDKTVIDGENLVRSKLSELYDNDKNAWIGKNSRYPETYNQEYLPAMQHRLKEAEKEERRVAKWASQPLAHTGDLNQWNRRLKIVREIRDEMLIDKYRYARNQIDAEFYRISRSVVLAISRMEPDTIE